MENHQTLESGSWRRGWREEILRAPEIQTSFLHSFSYASPLGQRGTQFWQLFFAVLWALLVANPLPQNSFLKVPQREEAKGIGHFLLCFGHLLATILSPFWRFWSLFCLSPFAAGWFFLNLWNQEWETDSGKSKREASQTGAWPKWRKFGAVAYKAWPLWHTNPDFCGARTACIGDGGGLQYNDTKEWGRELNTDFSFSNFSGTSWQNPGISRQKVWPGFQRRYRTFWPPPLHMEDPHPTRRDPDQKVWVWVPFSLSWKRTPRWALKRSQWALTIRRVSETPTPTGLGESAAVHLQFVRQCAPPFVSLYLLGF